MSKLILRGSRTFHGDEGLLWMVLYCKEQHRIIIIYKIRCTLYCPSEVLEPHYFLFFSFYIIRKRKLCNLSLETAELFKQPIYYM